MIIRKTFIYFLILTVFSSLLTIWVNKKINQVTDIGIDETYFPTQSLHDSMQTYKNKNLLYSVLVPNNVKIKENTTDNEDIFYIKKNYYLISENYGNLKHLESSISITVNQNKKDSDMSLQDWWDIYGFGEGERQTPTPYNVNSIMNGRVLILLFNANSNNFGLQYYDTKIALIEHNNLIYEIWGYKLPDNPSSDLTPEDIVAAREYEKIFNQIVNSISFEQ